MRERDLERSNDIMHEPKYWESDSDDEDKPYEESGPITRQPSRTRWKPEDEKFRAIDDEHNKQPNKHNQKYVNALTCKKLSLNLIINQSINHHINVGIILIFPVGSTQSYSKVTWNLSRFLFRDTG